MTNELNRRNFIRNSLALSAAGAIAGGGRQAAAGDQPASDAPKPQLNTVPTGKLGALQFSRLINGSNIITYYLHSRDLRYVSELARHYNTVPKIIETMALCEQHGINAQAIQSGEDFIRLFKEHRKQGGKMHWIVGVEAVGDGLGDYEYVVKESAGTGAAALYLHGNASEKLFRAGKLDMIGQVIEVMHKVKLPVGVGCHDLRVVELCEQRQWPIDYYVKTFHHHRYASAPRPEQLTGPYSENPGYWCKDPQEHIEVMKKCEKAWIAFKVMAAGAIPPKDAFNYAFKNGADHVLAGMFDFQVAADVKITNEVLAGIEKRERPWRS